MPYIWCCIINFPKTDGFSHYHVFINSADSHCQLLSCCLNIQVASPILWCCLQHLSTTIEKLNACSLAPLLACIWINPYLHVSWLNSRFTHLRHTELLVKSGGVCGLWLKKKTKNILFLPDIIRKFWCVFLTLPLLQSVNSIDFDGVMLTYSQWRSYFPIMKLQLFWPSHGT